MFHQMAFGLKAVIWFLLVGGAVPSATAQACGTLVELATHDGTMTRYSYAQAHVDAGSAPDTAIVLLIGGGGTLRLNEAGCPQSLNGNILVRSAPLFRAAGFATALVDAPSDHGGEEGLAGFRIDERHAADLGKIIADVKSRTGAKSVWVIGHSRGSLSALTAGTKLSARMAPDGVVLASPMMSGERGKRRPWAAQTVFDLPLESLRSALLVVGHEADNCPRSLPTAMSDVVARTPNIRHQVALVGGGSVPVGRAPHLAACETKEPHDFVGQDAEFAAGVGRFIRGGRF